MLKALVKHITSSYNTQKFERSGQMSRRGKNEGSIFQRKDGRWVGQIQIGHYPDGRRKFVSYYGKTRREVARKLEDSISSFNHHTFIEPSKITFEEWVWCWMKNFKRRSVSESTYARYFSLINNYISPQIGYIKLQDVRSIHIQGVYNYCVDKHLSGSCIKHIHTVFKQSLDQAINQNLISTNPALKTIRPPVRNKPVTVLTVEQQERLVASLKNDTAGTLIKLALGTGARIGELLGLRWEHVDFENMEIHIVQGLVRDFEFDEETHTAHAKSLKLSKLKTESSLRTIPLTNYLASVLQNYKKNQRRYMKRLGSNVMVLSDLVFTNDSGDYLDESNARKKYAMLLQKAGIPYIKFHALRHTFATRILEANVHPKVAQELLGHSNASTTLDIYSHVLPNQKRDAIKKLEGII